jgi:hypothetical protein
MRSFTFLGAIALCLYSAASTQPANGQSALPQREADKLLDVSQLARLSPVTTGMFSSYDRSGGNDDGFSGKNSYLRKEGDGLVIAELEGPGAVTRIWTPTPIHAPIEFYIDGGTQPQIAMPFDQLFSGTQEPFTGPLVGRGLGGFWSYVPVAFQRSLKVIVRAPKLQFYQINYALFPRRTDVGAIRTAKLVPVDTSVAQRLSAEVLLGPGKSVTLYETTRPGRILSLKLGPSSAFAGDMRDVDLRMSWDGQSAAIDMPVSEFFAYSFGQPAVRSFIAGTEGETNYFNAPMPFSRGARIELVSRRTVGRPIRVSAELMVSGKSREVGEGYLHARWARQLHVPRGVPFKMADLRGRGKVIGFALQAQGWQPGNTGFFEGDDVVEIDGKLAVHGTGTEDMLNGGWYGLPARWNGRGSLPFSGSLDYSRQTSRTGGYRWLIGDAYRFDHSLKFTVEHGPEENADDADYAGTVFYYLDHPAGEATLNQHRQVEKPTAFRLGTYPLAGLDTLIDATLTPAFKRLTTSDVSVVTFARRRGAADQQFLDEFGPPLLSLRVEAPQTGRYAILVDAIKGPEAAKLQLRDENFQAVGQPSDFYAPTEARSGFVEIGRVDLLEGLNVINLTMPERNAASRGAQISIIEIEGKLAPNDGAVSNQRVESVPAS